MKRTLIALSLAALLPLGGQAMAADEMFSAIAFGQSTDLNFATNVLENKIGVNYVYLKDGSNAPDTPQKVELPFKIESRGGKIGNSHDGLTFYYTKLPIDQNFVLEATVKVDQFGPENGAKPAAQEGCGLLVRDILGKERTPVLEPGVEEFPAASNMVMTTVLTQDRKDHTTVKIVQMDRNGITAPYGNAGATMKRHDVATNLDLNAADTFKLRLERTDDGFISSYAPQGSDQWVSHKTKGADRLGVIDQDSYYVGFFAARNAAMTVLDYSLTTSPAHTKADGYVSPATPLLVQCASPQITADPDSYAFSFRANAKGRLSVSLNGVEVALADLEEGSFYAVPLKVAPCFEVSYTFASQSGETAEDSFKVQVLSVADPAHVYASPKGKASAQGTQDDPLDVVTALQAVKAGGVVELLDGEYPLTVLDPLCSGQEGALKTLKGSLDAVFRGLDLNASFIKLEGFTVTEKPLNVAGSYNVLQSVTAHHCDDTGIWVASPAEYGRPLWAHHNQILDCTSYQNQDPGNINADGFAVKMRVGEGNIIVNALSWGNADDGYDLFNKIEDGPNGAVVIKDSIAAFNKNNGFKMGGEGLPVNHSVSGCLSYRNGMDGFTDNFNPGVLQVHDNLSVDNARFNYIYRHGPFVKSPEDQGQFSDNLSIRTKEGVYPDLVTGKILDGNAFLESTAPNDQGYAVKERKPGDIPPRDASGKLDFTYFVTLKER